MFFRQSIHIEYSSSIAAGSCYVQVVNNVTLHEPPTGKGQLRPNGNSFYLKSRPWEL